MKKFAGSVLALMTAAALASFPAMASDHVTAISGIFSPTKTGAFPSLIVSAPSSFASYGQLAFSDVKFAPVLKPGYRRMGMNVKVPVPFEVTVQGSQSYKGTAVELRLPDANLWVIEAGLEVGFSRSFKCGLSGASNIIQNLATRLGGYVDSEIETRLRKGHPLNWIEADASISYFLYDPFAIVAGFRWDYFDLTIKDPAALARVNVGPYPNVGLLASDVLSNLWIPYVGVEFAGKKVKLKMIGSLFGWANVKVSARMKGDIVPSQAFSAQNTITMLNAPYFVEAGLEYDLSLAEKTNINFWGKGGWLGASGGGRLESSFSATGSGLTISGLDDRDVAYSRYSVAGGIAVKMAF